jgi:phospholipase C
MDTRREFLKKAAFLSGAAGLWSAFPESLQKALAIEPEPGSSYLDAEHVVILMQENRSFDHAFGTLRGVRGFNDPRALAFPNKNPVWLQTDAAGRTYAPFRLDLKDTKATWMGSLPHSWSNQVDAGNGGMHDRWLIAKRSGNKDYAEMPLTMGHYVREDLPFYYAFADAFTICDQHFCSSLTGTTPNRLYLWTGTLRASQTPDSPANTLNEDVDYGSEASWTTFPERLEDHGVSWKIYQNELSVGAGFQGEEDSWLANFTDNPLEFFSQYNVRFAKGYRSALDRRAQALPAEIEALEKQADARSGAEAEKVREQIREKKEELSRVEEERERRSLENFEKLSQKARNLHAKAFADNSGDPFYHELETLTYRDGATERRAQAPKGDVLHQFRQDVRNGALPTVSWLVAPENFSDHPGAPWYGAWYVSEVLDILTQNPDVWKKTILLLTYDENDGYFDHIPPFAAPNPDDPETGLVSQGIDAGVEYVTLEQDRKRRSAGAARESSIGLGYRVPMVIASPWSRGGNVCSQTFDHTSVLQFLERLLTRKTGKPIRETNVSQWRRAVCGDLSSAFQSAREAKTAVPPFPDRDAFIEEIHKAQFKGLPAGYKRLTEEEIEAVRRDPRSSPSLPPQEKGIRRACPLPYQLYADGGLNADRSRFVVRFEARNEIFGNRSAGSPFNVYSIDGSGEARRRSYAVAAGDRLEDSWEIGEPEGGAYHLQVYGPNGFFREFKGERGGPPVEIHVEYRRAAGDGGSLSGDTEIRAVNRDGRSHTLEIRDNAYKTGDKKVTLPAGGTATVVVPAGRSHGWYDFSVRAGGDATFENRYAGRVETGKWSYSDPAMG